jgi:hypothetical protein
MSLIGSIGQSLFHLFQSVGGNQPTNSQTTPTTGSSSLSSTTSSIESTLSQAIQGSGHHHHHHHGGGSSEANGSDSAGQSSGIFGQIESAVVSALQSSSAAQSTTGPTDLDQVVQSAITSVLTGKAPSTSNPTDAGATDQADSDGQTTGASFIQTLEKYGISAEQFRKDFLTAIQGLNGAQSGSAATTASQAIPPGSLLDEIA